MNENAFLPQELDVDYQRDRPARVELVHVLSEECPGGVNVFRRNVHLSREPPGLVPGLLQLSRRALSCLLQLSRHALSASAQVAMALIFFWISPT